MSQHHFVSLPGAFYGGVRTSRKETDPSASHLGNKQDQMPLRLLVTQHSLILVSNERNGASFLDLARG